MELLVAAVRWFVNLCKCALWDAAFWSLDRLDRLGIDLGGADFGSGGFGGGGGDGA